MTGDEPASEVVLEARAAREAGRLWQARDLLSAHVEEERDAPALRDLADVLTEMGDLPRAGAIWFATGAQGPDVDAAVAAWREQTHDDFAAMWRSLPASVRAEPRPRRVEALREQALKAEATRAAESAAGEGTASDLGAVDDDGGGVDANWLVAWVLAVAFVVFAVIGFVTALGWIVPG